MVQREDRHQARSMKSKLQRPAGTQRSLDEATRREAAELFVQHGALWMENVLPCRLVDQLHQAFVDRYGQRSRATLRKRHAAVGDDRYMITVKIKPPFQTPMLYANPVWMPILRDLLGQDCNISSFGAVLAMAGAEAQPAHFDYPPLFESEQLCASLPPHAITVVVPLVDLDEKTGTTAIWEGSHSQIGARDRLQRIVAESSWDGAALPLAKAGDVYLMDYRLIHAGMANRSDRDRPILYIVYRRPWFHEEKNFDEQLPLRISAKQLQRVPKEFRHLFVSARPS